jgi:hypothetical protein
MDEISQEDELIAQFAGVASVPASEVRRLQLKQQASWLRTDTRPVG